MKNDRAVGLAARLNAVAEDWSKDRRSKTHLLLKGVPLCQAAELLEKHPDLLKPEARDFVVGGKLVAPGVHACFGSRLRV